MLYGPNIATAGHVWTEVSDVVPLVGTEPVDLVLHTVRGGVVQDNPFPGGVGLGFQRGPGSR